MKVRVAVIADFLEEGWPSMDLTAEMLHRELQCQQSTAIVPELVRPPFIRGCTRFAPRAAWAMNFDRALNRFVYYPRYLHRISKEFDLFHVVDHSYAHLVMRLPAQRAIVTCHDLDAFRPVLGKRAAHRHRVIARKLLAGMRRAGAIVCDSSAVRDELIASNLVRDSKILVAPLGAHPACTAASDSIADKEAEALLGRQSGGYIDIVHVGSTIPRKRIDVLLEVIATIRKELPTVRLLRVGGRFTKEQERTVRGLSLGNSIVVLPFLSRRVLGAVFRRAALMLLPSDAEGFGLPVIESMACGTPVICSDIPVLREVAGDAAAYCRVGVVAEWVRTVRALLREREELPLQWESRRKTGLARASNFNWSESARRITSLYEATLSRARLDGGFGKGYREAPMDSSA